MTYELRKTDENVLIAEGASVTGDVRLAKGVSIWYGAVLRGDMGPITVGADTNIQDGAILHEETVVGRGCTIGHGAIVHGCTVGDNTLIGMGPLSSTARRSAATVSWVPGPWSPEKWTPRTGP
ncbi:MAG: gamma carbonic anhydrase family protein [Oscillibacter sp.]